MMALIFSLYTHEALVYLLELPAGVVVVQLQDSALVGEESDLHRPRGKSFNSSDAALCCTWITSPLYRSSSTCSIVQIFSTQPGARTLPLTDAAIQSTSMEKLAYEQLQFDLPDIPIQQLLALKAKVSLNLPPCGSIFIKNDNLL